MITDKAAIEFYLCRSINFIMWFNYKYSYLENPLYNLLVRDIEYIFQRLEDVLKVYIHRYDYLMFDARHWNICSYRSDKIQVIYIYKINTQNDIWFIVISVAVCGRRCQ